MQKRNFSNARFSNPAKLWGLNEKDIARKTNMSKESFFNILNDIQSKWSLLPDTSQIKISISESDLTKMHKIIEKLAESDFTTLKWPPVFLFIYRHDIEQIKAFDSDVDIVRQNSGGKEKNEIVNFLKATNDVNSDRVWAAHQFEIFAKSTALKEPGIQAQLGYSLDNGRNVDIKILSKNYEYYIECTILSDSNEDREYFDSLMQGSSSSSSVSSFDIYKECLRLYQKIYDKLVYNFDLAQYQVPPHKKNILFISLESPKSLLGECRLMRSVLDELFKDDVSRDEVNNVRGNISLYNWLYYTGRRLIEDGRLTQAYFNNNIDSLLNARRRVGAIFIFDRVNLVESRLNYNADDVSRLSHDEIAAFEAVFKKGPIWYNEN